jgi:hypothetical protein
MQGETMKFFEKKTVKNDSGTPEMQDIEPGNGGGKFSPRRIVIGVIATVVLLWLISTVIGFFMPPASRQEATNELITDNSGPGVSDQDSRSVTDGHEASEASPMVSSQDTKGVVPPSSEPPANIAKTEPDSQDVITNRGTKESITQTLEPGRQTPGSPPRPVLLRSQKAVKIPPTKRRQHPPLLLSLL